MFIGTPAAGVLMPASSNFMGVGPPAAGAVVVVVVLDLEALKIQRRSATRHMKKRILRGCQFEGFGGRMAGMRRGTP